MSLRDGEAGPTSGLYERRHIDVIKQDGVMKHIRSVREKEMGEGGGSHSVQSQAVRLTRLLHAVHLALLLLSLLLLLLKLLLE